MRKLVFKRYNKKLWSDPTSPTDGFYIGYAKTLWGDTISSTNAIYNGCIGKKRKTEKATSNKKKASTNRD